jgi:hypothetical protein
MLTPYSRPGISQASPQLLSERAKCEVDEVAEHIGREGQQLDAVVVGAGSSGLYALHDPKGSAHGNRRRGGRR